MASSSASALSPIALLAKLSTLAPAALPLLPKLLQETALASILLEAFHQLALKTLSLTVLSQKEQEHTIAFVKLLRRLLARGDVRSAKELIGLTGAVDDESQLEVLLCVVIASYGIQAVHQPLRVIILRLLTQSQQSHLLSAATASFPLQSTDEERLARSAHTLAALLQVLPVALIQREQSSLSSLLTQSYIRLSSAVTSPSHTPAALHLLDSSAVLKAIGASLDSQLSQALNVKSTGWKSLAAHLATSTRAPTTANGPEPDEETLDTLLGILPHLERSELKRRIAKPRYAGLGVNAIVALLLDEPFSPTATGAAEPILAPALVSESRTKFAFDPSRLHWGGGTRAAAQADSELSAHLKALTLARAEADSESELDDDDPWAPHAASRRTAVGFEEELDEMEIEAPQHRRKAISTLVGERGEARTAWGGEDASEGEEEHELHKASTAATRAQIAEDTLRRAYIAHGKSMFEKSSNVRNSAPRRELLASLGATWDHTLVEDWATVFERNPKRDAILARASVSAPLARPSRSATPAAATDSSDDERPRWGPDRGRGGRIMRGGGGAGNGRGGGGGRGGSALGGSARGGTATGHSGNDRSARNKEKRGNMARQRGHDRKVARGGAGAAS